LEIGMSSLADLAPKNRGELRTRVKNWNEPDPLVRKEWTPYREAE
jgi:hypothetical protein